VEYLSAGRKIEAVRELSVDKSAFVELSANDWVSPSFDVPTVPAMHASFGVFDLVIGAVSTVYVCSFFPRGGYQL